MRKMGPPGEVVCGGGGHRRGEVRQGWGDGCEWIREGFAVEIREGRTRKMRKNEKEKSKRKIEKDKKKELKRKRERHYGHFILLSILHNKKKLFCQTFP